MSATSWPKLSIACKPEIDRVNLRTRKIVARLPVRGVPISLAVGFGSVWVRDDTGRVLRIKPQP